MRYCLNKSAYCPADCPRKVRGRSQNAAIFTYRSVRFPRFLTARSHLRKNPHKHNSECYNALADVQREEVFIMDMTARFKAYRDLNREIDLQIERLEQLEAKAGSPSEPLRDAQRLQLPA